MLLIVGLTKSVVVIVISGMKNNLNRKKILLILLDTRQEIGLGVESPAWGGAR